MKLWCTFFHLHYFQNLGLYSQLTLPERSKVYEHVCFEALGVLWPDDGTVRKSTRLPWLYPGLCIALTQRIWWRDKGSGRRLAQVWLRLFGKISPGIVQSSTPSNWVEVKTLDFSPYKRDTRMYVSKGKRIFVSFFNGCVFSVQKSTHT